MRQPFALPEPTGEELAALDRLYRTTQVPRLRTRAQIVLLALEQRLAAPAIAAIVREHETTALRWLKRYRAEGLAGLHDRPVPGAPTKTDEAYATRLVAAVRRRPRSLGLPYSLWTLRRLADYMAEETGVRISYETVRRLLAAADIVLSRPQHTVSSPDPEYAVKKAVEAARDNPHAGDAFDYADEFNLSWLPTRRARWSPQGQQVMIPTPAQPHRRYGIGAVNYHTGETVIRFERRKRRKEIALLLEALLAKHPTGTVFVAWDNAGTHEDDEIDDLVRAAAGRLVLLYLPTYSPWLNPLEMRWRHFRREVTHCELFTTMADLLTAATDFFARHNREPRTVLSVIGSKAAISV